MTGEARNPDEGFRNRRRRPLSAAEVTRWRCVLIASAVVAVTGLLGQRLVLALTGVGMLCLLAVLPTHQRRQVLARDTP